MLADKTIAFIGAGYMGGAIIRGLVSSGAVTGPQIVAADLNDDALTALADESGIATTNDSRVALEKADIVVLAVKPQIIREVIEGLAAASADRLFISIAAGVSTSVIEKRLHPAARVVRAMPNMGATLGAGASAVAAGSRATDADVAFAQTIFEAVGISVRVEESQIDAVTGLSGSGPAYVFLFLKALINGGVAAGLAPDVAQKLAEQTLLGSAMLARESADSPDQLITRITSPGGTTLAGLASLNENGFCDTVIKGVAAAVARSKELGE